MKYISKTVDVDVEIEYDDLDVDEMIDALKWHEKNGSQDDKKLIKEYKARVSNQSDKITLCDQLKYESFEEGKDNKSLWEIQQFFSF